MFEYESEKNYLISWKSDGKTEVTDGWNLNAIKHRDFKEGVSSVTVLREATPNDMKKYSSC